MYVCMCHNVTSTMVQLGIAECPLKPFDPFSRDYKSDEEQIYEYLVDKYKLGTDCGNCKIFTKQVIRDALNARTSVGLRGDCADNR